MLLSSSPSLSPPPSFSPPHRYHSASGGSISVVKAENDDGDEDMLDTSPSPNPYPYQCDGGNGMLEEVNEEEEEEDLFSSLEETPFASQDMGGAGEEEMLDDEDDEVEMGEGLLLGEDEELSSSRLGMEESWCGGSRGGVLCVEGTGVDGLGCLEEGMEDEEVWGMLF